MDHQKDPTLFELLEEPIVIALMKRDGISRENMHQLLEQVRRNLRAREERMAA
ncbi:hypothetical protein [Azospirillum soli]|uniref:hypothetical protein n=1 Tax=Azospirillum soli TaxID=1304799 RepID=UPI001AE7C306|nr:hypothetical protein [Azospirillum soli]MBP2313783.1 hypothetical protein [Azospirillum soli]